MLGVAATGKSERERRHACGHGGTRFSLGCGKAAPSSAAPTSTALWRRPPRRRPRHRNPPRPGHPHHEAAPGRQPGRSHARPRHPASPPRTGRVNGVRAPGQSTETTTKVLARYDELSRLRMTMIAYSWRPDPQICILATTIILLYALYAERLPCHASS